MRMSCGCRRPVCVSQGNGSGARGICRPEVKKTVSTLEKTKVRIEISKVLSVFPKVLTVFPRSGSVVAGGASADLYRSKFDSCRF